MDEDWITIQHVHILTGMSAERGKQKRQKRAVTILREVLARGREDGSQHTVGGLTSEKGTVIQPIHELGGRAD